MGMGGSRVEGWEKQPDRNLMGREGNWQDTKGKKR